MNLTVDHLIQTTYKEFSNHRIERFTLTDLSRISKIHRNSIYYHFNDIAHLYRVIFERVILKEITENCKTTDELLKRTVKYIDKHRIFCLNMYNHGALNADFTNIVVFLDEVIFKYREKNSSKRGSLIGGFLVILNCWFDNDLRDDSQKICNDLLEYNRFLRGFDFDD